MHAALHDEQRHAHLVRVRVRAKVRVRVRVRLRLRVRVRARVRARVRDRVIRLSMMSSVTPTVPANDQMSGMCTPA